MPKSQSGYTAALVLAAFAPFAGAGESAFDKDRAAILAMAGEYEVRFKFDETVSFREHRPAAHPREQGRRARRQALAPGLDL
jgi:hypothetical protein